MTGPELNVLLNAERRGELTPEQAQIMKAGREAGLIPQQSLPPERSLSTVKSQGPPAVERRPLGLTLIEEGLPIVGGVGGAAVGAPGGPLTSAGGAVGGAMAGRAASPYVAEYFGYTPSAPTTGSYAGDIALEGLTGGAGEVGARFLLPPMVAAGRRVLMGTPSMRAAPGAAADVATLGRAGVEPTLADVLRPESLAAKREQALGMTPAGGAAVQASRTGRAEALTRAADDIGAGIAPLGAGTTASRGEAARDAIERTLTNVRQAETRAWTDLGTQVGPHARIDNTAVRQRAQMLLDRQMLLDPPDRDAGLMRSLQAIVNGPQTLSFAQFQARRSTWLEEAGRPLLAREKGAAAYGELAQAALHDIEAGLAPVHGAAWARARGITERRHRLIEDMKINQLRDLSPEKVADLVEGKLTGTDLERLREALMGLPGTGTPIPTPGGPQAWNQIRRAVLDKAIERSRRALGGTETRLISGDALRKELDKIPGIDVLLDPGERRALDTVQRAADIIQRSIRSGTAVGSATAQSQRFQKRGAVASKLTGAGALGLGKLLTDDYALIATLGLAGAGAGEGVSRFLEHATARLLTDPRVARQLASPMAQRWLREFEETGVMPRMFARMLGQAGAQATVGRGR